MAETSRRSEERAKKLCYKRRASSIIKKTNELQTLCDVKVGVVILGPDGKLESCWPPRLSDVKSLFDACKEWPKVKSQKRKRSPDDENCSQNCGREILVSKLQLLKQREEFLKSGKGKEIAATMSQVRSEGHREILNSKLHILNNREMLLNNSKIQISESMETIESLLCDDTQNDLGPFNNDDLDDDFFNFEFEKEMGRMDSGIVQCSESDENGEFITGGLWYDGINTSTSSANQNCFSDLYNTGGEEYEVRKKARLLINSLKDDDLLPPQHWESVFTHALQNYTEEAEDFLKLQF